VSDFYSAVFFDMDGLFVDSEPQWLVAETELMAEFGYEWTSVDQNYCLGGPLTRVGKYMFEKAGSIESPDFFTQSIIKRMVIRLSSGAPVLPGALELLRDLQANNVPTALVPEAYLRAADRLLVDIQNCLILEDSQTGVKAATSSGAFTIAVPHFIEIEPRERLRVISSLSELNYERLRINYEQDK